jgi:chorismate synthase
MNNSFGRIFKITTWGESHGRAIGVVIDGCPAGLEISEDDIQVELNKRAPGNISFTSPRKESDRAEIFSGLFEGRTTGAPISIIISNRDANRSHYDDLKNFYRPGHANYTYLQKYGIFDPYGGGRSSGRETACRVAAGAVAKKILRQLGIQIRAILTEIGGCYDPQKMQEILEEVFQAGDSVGGIISCEIFNLPPGLGDPIYGKIESLLSDAMLSIPASKGFEIGEGFKVSQMKGSQHNDSFKLNAGSVTTETNHAGGTLGGITVGTPLLFRVAFKPTSSIKIPQKTLTLSHEERDLKQPAEARHDPCIAIRAVPVVEAMAALVIVDAYLCNRVSRIKEENNLSFS